MKKVNGFPVFPDSEDEGNGKPEPNPGNDKDNMYNNMLVQIRKTLSRLDEVSEIIAYWQYQLQITKDESLKAVQEQELKDWKLERARLGEELTKLVILRVILRELQEISEALDYWQNQVTIGETEARKELRETAVENLKRARNRLIDELRTINRKRIDE